MTDTLSRAGRSKVMAAVRSRGNLATELTLVGLLRKFRITGWRRHQRLPGSPDFVFPSKRAVIFVDGCFWHGCRWHCRMPKSRLEYWVGKIEGNRKRDKRVDDLLKLRGWRVLRVWEHSLNNEDAVIQKIKSLLSRPKL